MTPGAVNLDYVPSSEHRRRQRIYAVVRLLLLLISVALLIQTGRWEWERFQVMRVQRPCLDYSPPADRIALQFVPGATSLPQRSDPRYSTASDVAGSYLVFDPPEWAKFESAFWGGPRLHDGVPTFLHGRRTPSGQARLVFVAINVGGGCGTWQDNLRGWFTHTYVYSPATPFRREGLRSAPNSTPFPVQPSLSHPVTVFVGVADPADESHFTIRGYEGDQPFLLDGWLRNDDTVALERRAEAALTPPPPPSPASPR